MNALPMYDATADTIQRTGDKLWLPTALSLYFVQPELSGTAAAVVLALLAIPACVVGASGVLHLRDLLA